MINVIILGDRYQKGKKSKGCPGLIDLDKKTILEHQINNITKILPNCIIHYVSGFDNEKLKSYIEKNNLQNKINIIENNEYDNFNESYSLSIALNIIEKPTNILVLSGYYIPSINSFNNIDLSKSTLFIDNHRKTKLGCIINNNIVENIFFDLENYIQDIYLIQEKELNSIKKILSTNQFNNAFLFELINNAIDLGCIFYIHNLFQKHNKLYAKKKNSCI